MRSLRSVCSHLVGVLALPIAFGAAVGGAASGCAREPTTIVLIGGEKVPASVIDQDPIALLPSGAVLAGHVDAASLFTTSFGDDVAAIVSNLLPLGAEANFSPKRDVTQIYGGVYAMQGADFCAVLQGRFDVASISRAAETRAATPSGAPLVKTRYGDYDIYTTGNVGFVVLTGQTILSGNETGMRRAVDRLRYGKLQRSLPAWIVDLMGTPGAAFAFAGDFTSPGAGAAVAQRVPSLADARTLRVIGNFQAPGMNFAGTIGYADQASATAGAASLSDVRQFIQSVGWLASIGFGAQAPNLKVAQQGSDVAFTMPVDGRFVSGMLRMLASGTAFAKR